MTAERLRVATIGAWGHVGIPIGELIAQGTGPTAVGLPPADRIHERFLRSLMGKADASFAKDLSDEIFLLTNACLRAQDAVDTARTVRIQPL